MPRAVAAVLVAALLRTLASPPQATADGGPGSGDNRGWTDNQGVGASASQQVAPASTSSGTGGGGKSACTYEALGAEEAAIADRMAVNGWGPPKGAGQGVWYWKTCVDSNGMSSGVIVWSSAPAAVRLSALAQQALRYTPMPPP